MNDLTRMEFWSADRRPAAIRPAGEFAAIVTSDRLPDAVDAVLETGGRVVAALQNDELIGYASIVRPSPVRWMGRLLARRWDDLDGLVELGALEVARAYRGKGLGSRIASAIVEDKRLEEAVLFGIGVVHHWDLRWSSRSPLAHRRVLSATVRHAGMSSWPTDDPEITMHPANALFARVGPRVAPSLREAFEGKLQGRNAC
ncbi:Acetyltransferase AcuA, acetyl-CoA synthetase inhibitor [Labilithrix luteola]|uniref:Acetyltransferase AcuA, acetyl-CoA synthetase inhibitor n=1 Tax=Labilithrix luteola TaxID=1391654 RepID=A0A0K1Q151_9BACT|nr:GNAT family N-acetyltransferase [Labilithrix luteola]AKU99510.1 Acetyltransferase AcuA, acetyl-CoA synthetase inhibitor [Labilithrix luteola]